MTQNYKLLSEPRPERIHSIAGMEVTGTFMLGVALRTHSGDGLKIIPQHELYIEIEKDGVSRSFTLPASTASALLPSQSAYIQYCDAQNSASVPQFLNRE